MYFFKSFEKDEKLTFQFHAKKISAIFDKNFFTSVCVKIQSRDGFHKISDNFGSCLGS